MTEQKKLIFKSADYIQSKSPFKKKSATAAVIVYSGCSLIKNLPVVKKIKYKDIPPTPKGNEINNGELIFSSLNSGKSKKNIYVLHGRYNFYDGYSMRQTAHPVYTLAELGVSSLLIIDEVGHLNPRFKTGGVSLIYDHINLMGDNPLIGINDDSLGPRFPDMSNAYDSVLADKAESLFVSNSFKYYPSVYVGLTGPETETEAECRFYREIGGDVLGYSLIQENIAAVHSGMRCLAVGMISRELVADRLTDISEKEQVSNRLHAEKKFSSVFKDIIEIL